MRKMLNENIRWYMSILLICLKLTKIRSNILQKKKIKKRRKNISNISVWFNMKIHWLIRFNRFFPLFETLKSKIFYWASLHIFPRFTARKIFKGLYWIFSILAHTYTLTSPAHTKICTNIIRRRNIHVLKQ